MNLPNKPKVLAATYNPVSNTRMISFLVDFPTCLLAELRTHRILTQGSLYEHMELDDFNMSANSARAIPTSKYLQKVTDNPFIPIWTKQQKGMSGEMFENVKVLNKDWITILNGYVNSYEESATSETYESDGLKHKYVDLIKKGVHKQNANRLLAPFAYTTCIISGTEWDNFFELRCPKYISENITAKSQKEYSKLAVELNETYPSDCEDWQSLNHSTSQPEFQVIAEMLYDLYQEADWKESQYHIPFEDEILSKYEIDYLLQDILQQRGLEANDINWVNVWHEMLMKISASMCAKLSYNTQENEDTLEKHLERAEMLLESKHWEPFSHQAQAMDKEEYLAFTKTFLIKEEGLIVQQTSYGHCYNNVGFMSFRYKLENIL